MSRFGVLLFLVLLPGLSMADVSRPFLPMDTPLNCQSLSGLMDRFFTRHVKYRASSPELDERFIDLYGKRIDGSRLKYTHGQYTGLKDRIRSALLNVRWHNCVPLEALWRERVAAQKNFEDAVRGLVDRPHLKIDGSLTVQLKAKKRPRSFNGAGLVADLKGILHFRLANYVAADVTLDEAKKKLIRRYTVDTKRLEEEKRTDTYAGWLKTYARALDPHSSYYSPDDLAEFKISMGLALEGIGVTLRSRDGFITILKVAPGGPTDKQGILKVKDKITSVAQGEQGTPVNIIDMPMREVVKLIRGKKGSKVKLTILRESPSTQSFEVVIVRDTINLEEQAAKLRWETVERKGRKLKLAVIDLPSFYGGRRVKRSCIEDVKRLLQQAEATADGVLFDLSRNGGGSLRSSVGISGLFMAHGGIVTIDGPAARKQNLVDRDGAIHYKGPVVVLASRSSASGSEILLGALKDYGRAVIVGDDRTFGKGTVQNILDLPKGLGALKVTTSYFYLPAGRTTQKEGVSSHIIVPTILNGGDHGEARKPYVLSGDRIEPFMSGVENVADPALRWQPVTDGHIAKLAALSNTRVSKSAEFRELAEERARRKANEGKVSIEKILSKSDGKADDSDDEKAKDKLSIQAQEALAILADFVELSQ